jgi:transposase
MLEKRGIKVSQKRVARRMKKMGLRSIVIKKFRPSGSKGKVDDTNKANLLAQNFKAAGLREKMVSDITYIYTKEKGWTYLAIVMDLYSLSVIGYSYGETMDADLVIKAIENARAKGKFKQGAIFHSDLGSQYTSNKVEKYLKELELVHSYSKKGYPYDNASMESFNAILKKEEVNLHVYNTFTEAKMVIFEFIEGWYNRRRIHSSLNYKIPYELENGVA